MAAVDELITECCSEAEAEHEFGFDVSPLISIAINLLTQWLGGCFQRATRAEVEQRIQEGGWRTDYMVSRAVRKASRECDCDMSGKGRRVIEGVIKSKAASGRLSAALDDVEQVNQWMMI
jgi:hypothetical protein